MIKKRKNYPATEKMAIIKRHLGDKVPGSDLCDQHGIHPTLFYRWQKGFFENGAVAFDKAVSPSSVYRVLREADLLHRWNGKKSKKRYRLCSAVEAARALARRCGLSQSSWDILQGSVKVVQVAALGGAEPQPGGPAPSSAIRL